MRTITSEDKKKKKAKPRTRGYVIRIGGARAVGEKAKKSLLDALSEEEESEKEQ